MNEKHDRQSNTGPENPGSDELKYESKIALVVGTAIAIIVISNLQQRLSQILRPCVYRALGQCSKRAAQFTSAILFGVEIHVEVASLQRLQLFTRKGVLSHKSAT